jgi:hypothetical protein
MVLSSCQNPYFLRQTEGASASTIGKISSLPSSMAALSASLTPLEKAA